MEHMLFRSMSGKKALSNPYALLTWKALEAAFGQRILNRGERYQQGGRVSGLARFVQNGLVARVVGSEVYVCRVFLLNGGQFQTACSCPYGVDCKHAVAVVLEYLECLKEKREVEWIQDTESDERLIKLEAGSAFDNDRHEARKPASRELGKFLRAKTKQELVTLCLGMSEAIPEARQWLQDQESLVAKNPSKFLKAIRSELAALQDTQWDSHGYGGHSADLTRLQTQLKALADLKEYGILTDLGTEILSAGNEAVGHEPESESAYELSECFDIIFAALEGSSLDTAELLLWAINLDLQDDYGICGDAAAGFLGRKHRKSAWSVVADQLRKRLASMPTPTSKSDYSQTYQRNGVFKHLSTALKQAGRSNELTAHYLSEAKAAGSYDELVTHLIEQQQWDDAKKYCITGIKAVRKTPFAGLVRRLYELLDQIYGATKNRSQQLALIADSFFSRPDLDRYQKLLKASKASQVSKAVDAWSRHFLETGKDPNQSSKRKVKLPWPFDPLEAPNQERYTSQNFPKFDVLIDIAIFEKKPDEVLRWYDAQVAAGKKSFAYSNSSPQAVAQLPSAVV